MKRVIVDFKKLNQPLLNLLVEKYPDGYGDRDIISFRNSDGDWVECIEVQTEDTTYLVKVSKRLTIAMEDFEMDTSNEDSLDADKSNTFEEE